MHILLSHNHVRLRFLFEKLFAIIFITDIFTEIINDLPQDR